VRLQEKRFLKQDTFRNATSSSEDNHTMRLNMDLVGLAIIVIVIYVGFSVGLGRRALDCL